MLVSVPPSVSSPPPVTVTVPVSVTVPPALMVTVPASVKEPDTLSRLPVSPTVVVPTLRTPVVFTVTGRRRSGCRRRSR